MHMQLLPQMDILSFYQALCPRHYIVHVGQVTLVKDSDFLNFYRDNSVSLLSYMKKSDHSILENENGINKILRIV